MNTLNIAKEGLSGKSVLVVGGTSGMGLATAQFAQAEGATVTVIGSNKEKTALVTLENGFTAGFAADVTRSEEFVDVLSKVGHVDHLVLLAGSFVFGTVVDSDMSYLRRAFDERVWAAVTAIKALGDRLDAKASITFISGVLADRPSRGTAILASASAAMEALGRGLAIELAPRRVNTIAPGTTNTPLISAVLGDQKTAYLQSVEEKLPVGQVPSSEHVANAILFLMKNAVMSGETLHIDGGQRLV